ncbi:MAG TPA: ankyrin repeat domain-containing protein [Pyrinomonadaceae bacterium]|nr:ankyrin repeat domain-containing protein [Pyrinomonadaceae bacterium]
MPDTHIGATFSVEASCAKENFLVQAVFRGRTSEVKTLLAGGLEPTWQSPDGWPLLHYAVMGGHAEVVELLLQAGADVNARTTDGVTPLLNAIEWGYSPVVRVLLDHEADLTTPDHYGRTALGIARRHCHGEIVSLLQAAMDERAPRHGPPSPKPKDEIEAPINCRLEEDENNE